MEKLNLLAALPEIVLLVAACLVLVVDVLSNRDPAHPRGVDKLAMVALLVTGLVCFAQFGDDTTRIPFDQHGLVAICAPRPVLFTNAEDDQWANPPGQFDVLRAAAPAYKLYGDEKPVADKVPEQGKLSDERLGYFIRPGKHAMTPDDWKVYVQFADRWLK